MESTHPNQDILDSLKVFGTFFSDPSIMPPFGDDETVFQALRNVDVMIASYTLNAFLAGDIPENDKVTYVGLMDIGEAIFLSRIFFLRHFIELRMAINSMPPGENYGYYNMTLSEQMDRTRIILSSYDDEDYSLVIDELEEIRIRTLNTWRGENSRDKEIDKSQLAAAYGLKAIIAALKVTLYQNTEGN